MRSMLMIPADRTAVGRRTSRRGKRAPPIVFVLLGGLTLASVTAHSGELHADARLPDAGAVVADAVAGSDPSPATNAARTVAGPIVAPGAVADGGGAVDAGAGGTKSVEPGFRNSFSLCGFIVLGLLQINYERRLGDRHGLMVEGSYGVFGANRHDWTVGASYRFHVKPSLDGLFFNAFWRYGQWRIGVELKEGGVTHAFKMNSELNLLGLGVGYRYQFDFGLTFVGRAGYGFPVGTTNKWTPSIPQDRGDQRLHEALLGLDFELSVGYSF